jgi:putative oxidoreductase
MIGTMNLLRQWLLYPPLSSPRGTTLIRVMVGAVFLSEAIMKFVFPDTLGPGRFSLLGIPAPGIMSPFDAVFEAGCGILLMLGLLTRLAAIPMIIDMVVAILSTKIPMLLGTSPLPLPPVPPQIGFWAVLHEVRSEYAQILGTIYLLLAGPGRQSLDALLAHGRQMSAAADRPARSSNRAGAATSATWRFLDWLVAVPTWGPRSIVLIRVMAGGVFLWEGVLKFVFPNSLGVHRFQLIGIPAPELMAPFIGGLEIVAGVLLIAGFLTRPAAILLIADIVVAIVTTKIPLLMGTSRLPLPPVAPQLGFWAMLHEGRSDYAQLMFTAFLLIAGPGAWALDAIMARRRLRPPTPVTVSGRPLPSPPEAPLHGGRTVRPIGG